MSNEVTMPDFEQWAKNLIHFINTYPDAAQAITKENIESIWNEARAYERQRILVKVDEWDKDSRVI